MMNVVLVGSEQGSAAEESSNQGYCGLNHRQAKRNQGNDDGHERRRRGARGLQRQTTEHEAQKQASSIAQKYGGGIEVVPQKAKDRATQKQSRENDASVIFRQS